MESSTSLITTFALSAMLIATPLYAQEQEAVQSNKYDIESLGKPLGNDTVDFYERFVYVNETTVSKDVPLDVPILTNGEVEDYLSEAIGATLSMNYSNYPQQIKVAEAYFTDSGYGTYKKMLERASLAELLEEQDYTLSTIATGRPELLAYGVDQQESYRWAYEVPIIMSYRNGDDTLDYPMILDVEIVRVEMATPDDTEIKIDYFILKEPVVDEDQKPEIPGS